MDYVLDGLDVEGRRRVLRADNLRDLLCGLFDALGPEFVLPRCVEVDLQDFTDGLMMLRVAFPADKEADAESDLACEVFENFGYLFGEGFYEGPGEEGGESMVWFLPKQANDRDLLRIS